MPLSPRLARRAALLVAGGAASVALTGPELRRRWRLAWKVEDAIWVRSSSREIAALNAAPLVGIEQQRLSYGPDPRQFVLWFHPTNPPTRRDDLIVFIHGGGWEGASVEYNTFLGRRFAEHGFTTLLAGYRALPEHTLPAMLEDLTSGLRAGMELSEQRGWRGTVTAIGQSAGAHLGALLTFASAPLVEDSRVQERIGRFLSLCGVLDFSLLRGSGLAGRLAELVGPGNDPQLADPLRHLTGARQARVLCVHGRRDWAVDPGHSRSFVDAVNLTGSGTAELLLAPTMHHINLLEVLYRPSRAATSVRTWLGY